MKTVLIMGQTPDPHIDSVAHVLRQMGARVLFFDVCHPENCLLSLRFSENDVNGLIGHQHRIKSGLSKIDAVWWRIKPFIFKSRVSGREAFWSEFAFREWRSILESLEWFTPKARWVNPRLSDLRARNKPAQLLVAKELGFCIPTTLISNNPSDVAGFLRNKQDAIYKVLTWYLEPPDMAIFASKVTLSQVRSNTDSIRVAPSIFQERMEKAYEIRVTTVGQKIFSARIDSQTREDTKLDWRRNQFQVPYSKHELPKYVEKLIRAMNNRLGLLYAAYDLIVTPDEDYYFLEVNPVGQWLWLEHKLDLPISKAIAELLVS